MKTNYFGYMVTLAGASAATYLTTQFTLPAIFCACVIYLIALFTYKLTTNK